MPYKLYIKNKHTTIDAELHVECVLFTVLLLSMLVDVRDTRNQTQRWQKGYSKRTITLRTIKSVPIVRIIIEKTD